MKSNATLLESVTVKLKLAEPAADGAPETTPLDDNASPAGNEHGLLHVQVYGGVPPLSPVSVDNDAVYETPTCPFGSVTGVFNVSGDGVQVIVIVTVEPTAPAVI